MSKKKTLYISLIILFAGGLITALIFLTEPAITRGGAVKETAMLVEVQEVRRGTFQPVIQATGTVRPSKEIVLSPRVSGEIMYCAEAFIPGGFVSQGDVLLQIDPADYRNILDLRKADLQQAISELNIEQGRQQVAQKGYQLIDETLAGMNRELILREPQLSAVKARVEAARAAVSQAELDLKRTRITAPFDAHILSRNVNEGSQVAAGSNLGSLVGMEEYWVVVTVPLSKIPRISFAGKGETRGSEVRIRDRKSWEEGEYRSGYAYRLLGALEGNTRMARLLVTVPDPLATQNKQLPRLMINGFVEVQIQGEAIRDVIRLSRDYLRRNQTVWVMEEGKLRIRDVEVIFTDAKYAYIAGGLNDSDRVVVTNLSTVAEGASLRTGETDTTSRQLNPVETPSRGGVW